MIHNLLWVSLSGGRLSSLSAHSCGCALYHALDDYRPPMILGELGRFGHHAVLLVPLARAIRLAAGPGLAAG